MTRTCSHCFLEKPVSKFDINGKYVYSVCKDCKRIATLARRYGYEGLKLQTVNLCQCCGDEFRNQRFKHIHHTSAGVQGVICQLCNHILAQESHETLHRIKCCLEFTITDSKNLFDRVNPQGSPSDPSTTDTLGSLTQTCKACKRKLPLTDFSLNKRWLRKTCKHCCVCQLQARTYNTTYEEVYNLRLRTQCGCCGCSFTDKNQAHIHHLQTGIRGLVCSACNRALGQETPEQVNRLEKCLTWLSEYDTV